MSQLHQKVNFNYNLKNENSDLLEKENIKLKKKQTKY